MWRVGSRSVLSLAYGRVGDFGTSDFDPAGIPNCRASRSPIRPGGTISLLEMFGPYSRVVIKDRWCHLGERSFKVIDQAARQARNPRTGETVAVPAKKVAVFKPSKELAALLNAEARRPRVRSKEAARPPKPWRRRRDWRTGNWLRRKDGMSTADRPFQCSVCRRHFRSYGSMKRHVGGSCGQGHGSLYNNHRISQA